jgi:hypothetical protein
LEYWLAAKIHDVDDDTEVEVVVIFEGELKSARGLLVHLAVMAVLRKMLNRLDLDFMTCSLKNPKQSVDGWVAKTTV